MRASFEKIQWIINHCNPNAWSIAFFFGEKDHLREVENQWKINGKANFANGKEKRKRTQINQTKNRFPIFRFRQDSVQRHRNTIRLKLHRTSENRFSQMKSSKNTFSIPEQIYFENHEPLVPTRIKSCFVVNCAYRYITMREEFKLSVRNQQVRFGCPGIVLWSPDGQTVIHDWKSPTQR